MIDLKSIYERAGFQLARGELPDYLPALLEYLSCRTLEEARDMLADCAHILRAIGERLAGRGSQYAAVFEALLAIVSESGLDWTRVPESPEKPAREVDEDWMDAPAFADQARADSVTPSACARVAANEIPLRRMPRNAR